MSTPSSASRLPIAERDVLDVADPQSVDERDARVDLVHDAARRRARARRREPFSAMRILSSGTPASRASFACAACIRYSPWIGMTWRGRRSESIVRSSSW